MARVVGTDPGTSSLDLLLLVDGQVADQARIEPGPGSTQALVDWLQARQPLDAMAGPSGYGLPLVPAHAVDATAVEFMALTRPDERGQALGVAGFRGWVEGLLRSGLPVTFLPGGIHLPTIPAYRKQHAIDLGTADKVAVAALAIAQELAQGRTEQEITFALVEIGSAFSSVLVVSGGAVVDAAAGTRGPLGARSPGAWDGEVAYWLSPLSKQDLFRGGLDDRPAEAGRAAFRESLRKHVAGLRAVTPFARIYLSGARRELAEGVLDDLGQVTALPCLPGAWVKHAAQGAAVLADGLAGGPHARVVDLLRLRDAAGTVLDFLPRAGPPLSSGRAALL